MNREKLRKELIIITFITLLSFFIFSKIDVLEYIVEWSKKHEEYEIDEIISTSIVFSLLMLIFSVNRIADLIKQNDIIDKKNKDLENAIHEIELLRGILPICSFCKKIKNDKGYWDQVETYISKHTEAQLSHGICPECLQQHYPDEYKMIKSNAEKEI